MDDLPRRPTMTLDRARAIVAAAEAQAGAMGLAACIAVVDDGGHLVAFHRMDDAQFGSVDVAMAKARSAAAFRRPTKAFEDTIAGGRTAALALPGSVPLEGGLPLVHDGRVVGAIGVSGATSAEDGQIASAGAAALG